MKRLVFIIILACLTLSVWGQPPSVVIITPVSGYYVAPVSDERIDPYTSLFLLNTLLGDIHIYSSSKPNIDSPVWSEMSNRVAIYVSEGFGADGIEIIENDVSSQVWQGSGLAFPMSWFENDSKLLFKYFNGGYDAIRILNLDDLTVTSVLEFPPNEEVTLPIDYLSYTVSNLEVEQITYADQNPVFQEWVLVQVVTSYSMIGVEGRFTTPATILYNIDSDMMITINHLVPSEPRYIRSKWSPDGHQMYFHLQDSQIAIIGFDPLAQEAILESLYIPSSFSIVDWLGISDLLLVKSGNEYYIGQIINNDLKLHAFFMIDDSASFWGIGDWKFTGTPEEAAELSCIFDETLPTRLEIGIQAQVAFTDGTPSRLRSEPSTWGDVVQSLPEGTAFEIIGGYMCGSGYRWWQVQFADGTQGWIAESSEMEYWIERRAS